MDLTTAVSALAALAHTGRISVFRLLVKTGKDGMAAGMISRETMIVPQTLSGYLNNLVHSGLVSARRQGRSIIYCANYDYITDLLGFMLQDCCGGSLDICGPLFDAFAPENSYMTPFSPSEGACVAR